MRDMKQFAAATPFEFPDIADATQKLLAFQFPLKETKPLLTAVGDALSGLGKMTPATLQQVVDVFGQMNAAGKIQTQDLMQLTSVGINGFQLLASNIRLSKDQVTSLQKAGITPAKDANALLAGSLHLTVAQLKDMVTNGLLPAGQGIEGLRAGMEKTFGGGMQKQSLTFNGLLSTFKDNASQALQSFTGPLFTAAKDGLTKLGTLVSSKSFQDFAQNAGKQMSQVLGNIGTILQTYIIPGFGKLIETGGKVVNFFKTNATAMDALKATLLGVGTVIAIVLVNAFIAWAIAAGAAAIATLAATWPLLAIGALVAVVVFGIIQAVKHWADIMKWFQGVWSAVSGWVGGVFSGLGSFIHGIISGIGGAFSGLGTLIRNIWDGIVGTIKGAINLIIGAINGFIGFIDSIQIHIPSIGVGPIHTPSFDWGGLGIPRIPYLASGGYIVQTGIAMVHAGETVVPATASAGGGGTTIIFEVDSVEMSRLVNKGTDRLVRLKLGAGGRAA